MRMRSLGLRASQSLTLSPYPLSVDVHLLAAVPVGQWGDEEDAGEEFERLKAARNKVCVGMGPGVRAFHICERWGWMKERRLDLHLPSQPDDPYIHHLPRRSDLHPNPMLQPKSDSDHPYPKLTGGEPSPPAGGDGAEQAQAQRVRRGGRGRQGEG